MRSVLLDRLGQVGQAHASPGVDEAGAVGDGTPRAVVGRRDLHRVREPVRVGHGDRPARPVDLEERHAARPHLERDRHGRDHPVRVLEDRGDVRVDLTRAPGSASRPARPSPQSARDPTARPPPTPARRDRRTTRGSSGSTAPCRGADRHPAGSRTPGPGATARGQGRSRRPRRAIGRPIAPPSSTASAVWMPDAEDGVRRAADAEALRRRQLEHRSCLGGRQGEGLLPVDVLARLEGPERDLGVRGRDGQVEDDVDLGVGQQLVDARRPHALFGGDGSGAVEVEVRDDDEREVRQLRELGEVLLARCSRRR